MLIILLVISIALIVVGILGVNIRKFPLEYDTSLGFIVSGVLCLCLGGVFFGIAVTNTIKIPQMEERISIYQEENTRIEEQIKVTIQVYQDYEKDIFGDIKLDQISSEKLIMLTSMYPELKSDTMVQQLIQVYIENTNSLKQLRMEKLDYEIWRWWLCFG